MWQKRWVIIHFIVGSWLYMGRLYCSVNMNPYDEFLSPDYCEDMEHLEDVTLLGTATNDAIPDDDKPKDPGEITIDDIGTNYRLFI